MKWFEGINIRNIMVLMAICIMAMLTGCGGSDSDDGVIVNEGVDAIIDNPAGTTVSIYQGTSIVLAAHASGGSNDFTYLWDFHGAATNVTVQNPGPVAFTKPGTYTVTFTATDSNELSGSDSFSLTVIADTNLSLVGEDMAAFAANPTDANYNKLMEDLAKIQNSTSANLYKAVGELLDIYRSQLVRDIMQEYGQNVTFDNFATVSARPDLNLLTLNYLKQNSYLADAQDLAGDTINRLDRIDNYLDQAQGISLGMPLGQLNTVYFDDVDISMLRCTVNLLKTYFVYFQAVNLTIVNPMVHYNGVLVDIRDLITDPVDPICPIRFEDDDLMMDGAWKELIANNPSLLTYNQRSARLATFKAALQDAINNYNSAVAALAGMTAEQRRARYHNAFNLDTAYELEMAKAGRDYLVVSVLNALNTPEQKITFPRSEQVKEECINGGDGFFYRREYYNIYLDEYTYDTHSPRITIFDLFGTASGAAMSPRDLLLKSWAMDELPDDYELYSCAVPSTTAYRTNVENTEWDEPIETFTIPAASITIDGNGADWTGVAAFRASGDTTMKLARDGSNNLYVYLHTSYTPPEGYWSWGTYYFLGMDYGEYLEAGWDSFRIWGNLHEDSYSGGLERETNLSDGSTIPDSDWKLIGNSGMEVKISGKLSRLLKPGSVNQYSISYYATGEVSWWEYEDIKFLPEAD